MDSECFNLLSLSFCLRKCGHRALFNTLKITALLKRGGLGGCLSDAWSLGIMIDDAHDDRPFGQRSGNDQMRTHSCQAIIGDCFLQQQQQQMHKFLADDILDEYDLGFIGVRRSWDEATVRLYCKSEDQLEELLLSLDLPHHILDIRRGKRMSVAVSVFQQRAYVARGQEVRPVYLPARFVDGCTAANFFKALEVSAPELAVARLHELSMRHEFVMLGLLADAHSSNENVQCGLALRLPKALVHTGRCCMHQGQRCFEHAVQPLRIQSAVHCIGCAMKSGRNQRAMIEAITHVGRSVVIRAGKPPPEAARYSKWVLEHSLSAVFGLEYLPQAMQTKFRHEIREREDRLLKYLNGRWWMLDIEHWEHGCCKDAKETKDGVVSALLEVLHLIWELDGNEGRWFQLIKANKPFVFGAACHKFLPRAFLRVCPIGEADTDEALVEAEDDAPQVLFGKRLKRGVKRMIEPEASQDCMIMAVTSVPIQMFNYWLHAEGRDSRLYENDLADGDEQVPTSVLCGLVTDDRAIIRRVSRELGDMVSQEDFWERCVFAIGTPAPTMMRNTRSSIVRCGAEYFYRVDDYYAGTPLDFVTLPSMSVDEEEQFWEAFFKQSKCCKQPFFCRRVHERFEADYKETLVGNGRFCAAVAFWSGEGGGGGETGTTIRNEHQNARFAASVRIRKKQGGKAMRIVTHSFVKTIADDHRTLFKLPRRRKLVEAKALRLKLCVLSWFQILIHPCFLLLIISKLHKNPFARVGIHSDLFVARATTRNSNY